MVGILQNGAIMINCHQLGFGSNPSATVATGPLIVGGLVGNVLNSTILQSGITQGNVCGSSSSTGGGTIGAVAGSMYDPMRVDQIYAYAQASVSNKCKYSGGIAGELLICSQGNYNLTNMYSRFVSSRIYQL